MSAIPISETVPLKSVGLNEAWLQTQIWETPSCLGLGELESVIREHAVSSGGRLDILLTNPVDGSMYSVETMLGETDPDHIVRTIEYWELVKRKWPKRQHFAVLVAERITKRFFNVIRILSDAIPLIAIQANIIRSPQGQSLHFTKILDIYEQPDDLATDDEIVDESYWIKRSPETLESAKYLLQITNKEYTNPELRLNKNSIVISSSGYNQLVFRKRSGNQVLVRFRFGDKRDEILKTLQDNEIQFSEQSHHFAFQMAPQMIKEKSEMFLRIAELTKDWWSS